MDFPSTYCDLYGQIIIFSSIGTPNFKEDKDYIKYVLDKGV